MNAYGHSTDGRSGFSQESGGFQDDGTVRPSVVHEEYDWQEPPQFPVQFEPQVQGIPESLPAGGDTPTER
jgi:hypothetical protein